MKVYELIQELNKCCAGHDVRIVDDNNVRWNADAFCVWRRDVDDEIIISFVKPVDSANQPVKISAIPITMSQCK
jgi:hypothetical protein